MRTTKEVFVSDITVDQISSVYVGKPNKCMCGCAGKYTYTSQNRAYASKDRGYDISDDEVNDARVTRAFNKFMKDEQVAENNDDYIFTKFIGKSQYTIYIKQAKK